MNPVLESIQANNCLQLSRAVTGIKENARGIKLILAASNESCWVLASGPRINKNKNKFRCSVTKRPRACSIRGKRKTSTCYASKLEAEIALFNFQYELENPKGKALVDERIENIKMKSDPVEEIEVRSEVVAGTASSLTNNSAPTENASDDNSENAIIKSVASMNFNRKDGQSESTIKRRCSKRKEMSMSHECANDDSNKTRNPNSHGLFGLPILPNKQCQMKRRLLGYCRRHRHQKMLEKESTIRKQIAKKLEEQLKSNNMPW